MTWKGLDELVFLPEQVMSTAFSDSDITRTIKVRRRCPSRRSKPASANLSGSSKDRIRPTAPAVQHVDTLHLRLHSFDWGGGRAHFPCLSTPHAVACVKIIAPASSPASWMSCSMRECTSLEKSSLAMSAGRSRSSRNCARRTLCRLCTSKIQNCALESNCPLREWPYHEAHVMHRSGHQACKSEQGGALPLRGSCRAPRWRMRRAARCIDLSPAPSGGAPRVTPSCMANIP